VLGGGILKSLMLRGRKLLWKVCEDAEIYVGSLLADQVFIDQFEFNSSL